MHLFHYFSVLIPAVYTQALACGGDNGTQITPVSLPDGRLPQNFTLSDFDNAATSPFSADFVKGQGLKFSSILQFPDVPPSIGDIPTNSKPVLVTIDDSSIFSPGGSAPQSAIRRAELIFEDNTANNVSTRGKRILNFSLRTDPELPLNLTHEYLLVFLETATFDANQFNVKTGTLIGSNSTDDPRTLRVFGNTKNNSPELFKTILTDGEWHNFALELDFDNNTIMVSYSIAENPVVAQTGALPNDLSGDGQYHFGMFKNAINPGADSLRSGFQESGIHEGLVYGGLHML